MNVNLRIIGALLAFGMFCAGAETSAARSDAAQDADAIGKMIAQLGDEQYSVRHRAEQQLLELGTAAFDQLLIAVNYADLEIAWRASYLLPRLRIEWVREDDSAKVRELMQTYGNMSQVKRLKIIQMLNVLKKNGGLPALCRIARFDATPTTARTAAMAILRRKVPADRLAWGVSVVNQETSGSLRVPVKWVQLHFDRLQQSVPAENPWLELIDQEIGLLKEESGQTDVDIVFGLLKYCLAECRQSDGQESTFEPLRRMVDLHVDLGGELRSALIFALSWSTNQKQWQTIEQLEDHFADQLREDRLLLYMMAEAADRQGDGERAKEISERAYWFEGGIEQSYQVANLLAELGRHDWAEREWQYVVDNSPDDDLVAIFARREIASMCLFDRGEFQEAADVLGEALTVINNSKNLKLWFKNKQRQPTLARYRAQQSFFLACLEESKGNFKQQRVHLEVAYQADNKNPDILISMYHLQDADEDYNKSTTIRIQSLSKNLEAQIKAEPNSPHHYNHWAWLISNTEGDFRKAVSHSLHSLFMTPGEPYMKGTLGICYDKMRSFDIMPASASYLDTLGRCYFAAGDLENAIKYQRQAIDQHPHLAVMRRQLELFERELAKREAK